MLVCSKKILQIADKHGYAVGAFNTSNLEFTKAIIDAASELNAPVIIQTSEKAIRYAGLKEIATIIQTIAKQSKIPVSLHLDHGKSINMVRDCIKNGYTSIMLDASDLPFQQNIVMTKQAVKLAHPRVSVEAELGILAGVEDHVKGEKTIYTDPEQARKFVKLTKVDSLAIAIGTSHGAYKFKGKPKLDFKRLKEINEHVKIPLVLHGASSIPKQLVAQANRFGAKIKNAHGVPDSEIRKAVKLGIRKVNEDTDLRLAFTAAIRKYLKTKKSDFDHRSILQAATELIKKTVISRIKILGSANKA
ncbi:class II fructose-1,6-bisphosphate aldolase [Candidatus Woesearchaeota archaeon]|nr:MAG: class II fructose-1,6-bisphosphate aldolase [Candidatus Woesearchaeota archaeon]